LENNLAAGALAVKALDLLAEYLASHARPPMPKQQRRRRNRCRRRNAWR